MATATLPAVSLERLINPTERQREFLRAIAEHDFVLYGGEAGGGKSYILRWWLVLFLVWCYKVLRLRNVTVGLFCEDYPTLNDRQISKIKYEFPPWLGELSASGVRNFTLRSEYGGGILALRNLDDPSKYYSAEFAAIAVDELTRNSLATFNDLRFRLRWPGVDRPKFGAGTNPGGPGHAWVKKYWVTKEYPLELEEKADQFALVRAKASDNPHLPAGYHESLLTLPPEMARRVAAGDWNVYTGQFFPQFDPARHVIAHSEAMARIKAWHVKWITGDWGYFHPACFHWLSKDENDRVTVYRELWDRAVSEQEWAERIARASRTADGKYERLQAFPFSWDAGRLSPRSTPKYPRSIMQLLADSLPQGMPHPHPTDSSPGSRMSGFRLIAQLLDADLLQISDSCPKLIQCLPSLIRAEDDPETVQKIDYTENEIGDDPADSLRMGLQHMLGASFKPRDVVRQEVLAKATENAPEGQAAQHRFMADLKLKQQWERKDKQTKMWWKRR